MFNDFIFSKVFLVFEFWMSLGLSFRCGDLKLCLSLNPRIESNKIDL